MARKEWADGGGGGNGIKENCSLVRSLPLIRSTNLARGKAAFRLGIQTLMFWFVGLVSFVLAD